jgi:hypothetical protein
MVALVEAKGLNLDRRGERHYSSAGYSVFARVLELAGGDSWGALMERYVFEPAGMDHTLHPAGGRLIPDRASSYHWSLEGLTNTQPKDLSYLVGAGSLYSNPRDIWRALRAVTTGVYGETAQAWVVRGRESFDWSGRTNGYSAYCQYYSAPKRAIIYCANVQTGVLERLVDGLTKLLDGETAPPLPLLEDLEVVEMSEETLRSYEGQYALRDNSLLDVRARDGSLYANDWELVPLGEDRFFCLQDFEPVRFVRDASGAIVRMDWGDEDPPYAIPRVGDLEP